MNKRKFSKALVWLLTLTMLIGIVPFTVSAETTWTVLNPLGQIQPVTNRPLAPRPATLENSRIALVYYAQPQNPHAVRAIGEMLEDIYSSTIEATLFDIGSSIGAKPLAFYNNFAQLYDAVVLGVADCAFSAWWAAYHARMIEQQGTPVVVLVHPNYQRALEVGAMDNGFTGLRSAVIDATLYSQGFIRMTAASNADFLRNDGRFKATFDAVVDALTSPLTTAEINPPAITTRQLAGWAANAPNPAARTLTVTGATEAIAARNFNTMAMDLGFGDGLPLIPPLQDLVTEMLAATTRQPNEILGKVMPRGGIITVEKVAINSVMAGARPEYFPVILAAMEAFSSNWEDGNLLYHSLLSSDNYAMLVLVAGPIVDELGISGQWGMHAAGNEASNLIGRSIRLSIRNIGQNRTGETDGTARIGRINDHALTVLGAEERLLPINPDGTRWRNTQTLMGFGDNQSTVTLLGFEAGSITTGTGGWMMAWTVDGVLNSVRGGLAAGPMNAGGVQISSVVRAGAEMAIRYNNITSMEAFRQNIANRLAAGAPMQSVYQILPVIAGDPQTGLNFRAVNNWYGPQSFQTRLITGATQTTHGRCAPAASAPLQFTVVRSADGTSATLTWSAPGRGTAAVYQVSKTGGSAAGVLNQGGVIPHTLATQAPPAVAAGSAIPAVPGVLPTDHPNDPAWVNATGMSHTFTGLTPGGDYVFVVRAVGTSADRYGFYLVNTANGPQPADAEHLAARGAWAMETPRPPDPPGQQLPGQQPPGQQQPVDPPPMIIPMTDIHHAYLIGFVDGTVRPSQTITRAEVATIFFRLLCDDFRTENWSQTNPFSDVVLTNWHNNAISTLAEIGLLQGRPDGTFRPDAPITRGEFVALASRFVDSSEIDVEDLDFEDVSGHWAEDYIDVLVALGWMRGDGNGMFRPNDNMTRAEVAAGVNRMLNRILENEAGKLGATGTIRTWPDNANANAWYFLYLKEATHSTDFDRSECGRFVIWQRILPHLDWTILERPNSTPQDMTRAIAAWR